MYNLNTFQFESAPIRVLVDGGDDPAEPLFVAKDIVAALGYHAVYPTLKTGLTLHCRELPQYYPIPIPNAAGQAQETRVIRERDVHRLILNSPLPHTGPFLGWFMDELLPRVSGGQEDQTPGERLLKLCESYRDIEYEMTRTARMIAHAVEPYKQQGDDY